MLRKSGLHPCRGALGLLGVMALCLGMDALFLSATPHDTAFRADFFCVDRLSGGMTFFLRPDGGAVGVRRGGGARSFAALCFSLCTLDSKVQGFKRIG